MTTSTAAETVSTEYLQGQFDELELLGGVAGAAMMKFNTFKNLTQLRIKEGLTEAKYRLKSSHNFNTLILKLEKNFFIIFWGDRFYFLLSQYQYQQMPIS